MTRELPETNDYSRTVVLVNAAIGIAVALLSAWWASSQEVFHEALFRVSPTVGTGAGTWEAIGSNWVAGNNIVWLNALIALIHFADVVMGLFILVMVFIHWGAFRRLASRMRPPGEPGTESEEVAADGGERA